MNPSKALSKLDDIIARLGKFKPIRAYHGSPHSFSRFDASKIGTGEGAQTFGHGLYFAGKEGVARGYRDKLSSGSLIVEGAESPLTERSMRDMGLGHGAISYIRRAVIEGRDPVAALRQVQSNYPVFSRRNNEMADAIAFLESAKGPLREHAGHMYEVEIGHPEGALLDWDATLASQPERIVDALQSIGVNTRPFSGKYLGYRVDGVQPTGRHAYEEAVSLARSASAPSRLSRADGSARAAKALSEVGIPGIKYWDAGSRAAGEGTRNYVVFPGAEDAITILRKYGFLPPVAAAAAMSGEDQ